MSASAEPQSAGQSGVSALMTAVMNRDTPKG
jgi:hypothetical protein